MRARTGPDDPDELEGSTLEDLDGESSEEPESDSLDDFGKVQL